MATRKLNNKRAIRADVWEASGGKCHHCGVQLDPFSNFDLDHLVPLVLGGEDVRENLVGSCGPCNKKRGHEARAEAFAMRLAAREPTPMRAGMNGETLRQRRRALHLTQLELAQRLGVTRQAVYAWEHGINPVPAWMGYVLSWFEHEAER